VPASAVPAIALLAGSALGLLAPDLPTVVWYVGVVVSAGGAVHAWRSSHATLLVGWVAVGFFTGGALLAAESWQRAWRPSLRVAFEQLASAERADPASNGSLTPLDDSVSAAITGTLRADAAPTPLGASLSLDVHEIETPCPRTVAGGVVLTIVGDHARGRVAEWRAGRVVRTTARLRRSSRYLNPGASDDERMLARRGTTLVGSVKSGALVEVVGLGGFTAETAAAVRAYVRRSIAATVGRRSGRAAGVVTAILIGDRAGLEPEIERRLQEAGTYHVIAISGGNIAILAGLTVGVFRVAGVLGPAAMLSAIVGLIAYGYLVGGGASVDRATLMAVVYFAGRAIDLRGPSLNTLALASGLLVAIDPLSIVDPGFVLTFGATAAILLGSSRLRLGELPKVAVPLAALLIASAAAEVALAPVSALLFSRVTFAGLVLNFAAVPLMGAAQLAGMAVVPLSFVSSTLASAAGWVAYAAAEGLIRSADLVRYLPAMTWRVAPPGWIAVSGYYAALILVWILPRWRAASVSCALLAAIWILAEPWRFASSAGDGRLHVTFIDVGQGDSAFVRFPRGAAWVVDAGGLSGSSSFDVGERVVAPVLRQAGIRRLQGMVLTHGDADHLGGARSLVKEFKPLDIWEGIPVPSFEPLHALKETAAQARSRWTNVQAADVTTIDDVQVVVRHPGLADWERQEVRNDDSIVLEILWRDVSIVLTGDIGREVEERIAPMFPPARLRIIKVAHHGSLTSSTPSFVRTLAPRVAIASVGRSNPFGHPVPAVLDRYRQAGAEVFRTDRDGAVMLDTDGHSLSLRTFNGRSFSAQ
jgi:competence protein ComEC